MSPEQIPVREWRDHAACSGTSLPIFTRGYGTSDELAEALMICAVCPVIDLCWDDAKRWGDQRTTVRGGSEPTQRVGTPCGTSAGARRHRRRNTDVCPECEAAEAMQRRLRERRTELRLRRIAASRHARNQPPIEGIAL